MDLHFAVPLREDSLVSRYTLTCAPPGGTVVTQPFTLEAVLAHVRATNDGRFRTNNKAPAVW